MSKGKRSPPHHLKGTTTTMTTKHREQTSKRTRNSDKAFRIQKGQETYEALMAEFLERAERIDRQREERERDA